MGTSYDFFNSFVQDFVTARLPKGSKILDVGAGAGKYGHMFKDTHHVDAVEVFTPSIAKYNLTTLYKQVFNQDICEFTFTENSYDLVIMGDVLEHLTIEQSHALLSKIADAKISVLVLVPYNYEQGALYGNDAEIHHQPDLTLEVFHNRYPGFTLVQGNDKQGVFFKHG